MAGCVKQGRVACKSDSEVERWDGRVEAARSACARCQGAGPNMQSRVERVAQTCMAARAEARYELAYMCEDDACGDFAESRFE